MTLFPDGTKERLHGHNYQVETVLEIDSSEGDSFLSFAGLKEEIRRVCDELDERVLLPRRGKNLQVVKQDAVEVEIMACGKRYVFPADEVLLLEMDNVVTETLAGHVADRLARAWDTLFSSGRIRSLGVTVRETAGQGASVVVTR